MHILVIFAVIFTKRWKWVTNIEVNELTLYNQVDLNKIRTSFIHMKEVYGNFRDLSEFDFDLAANKFTLQQEEYIEQVEELAKCVV